VNTVTEPLLKAALYLRVSTGEQNSASQRAELDMHTAKNGWQVCEVYEDVASGGKASRPALDRLLADARARRFDIVLVWKLDRFGRSLRDCLGGERAGDCADVWGGIGDGDARVERRGVGDDSVATHPADSRYCCSARAPVVHAVGLLAERVHSIAGRCDSVACF
jgi:hypothetical protein